MVQIKKVKTDDEESRIARMFSTEPLRSDPRNHCVPILESFQDDQDADVTYLVMPWLRSMDDPPFELVGDVVDFADQIIEV